MSIDRDQLLIDDAQRQLEALGVSAVGFKVDLEIAIALIGFAQLGLRHPTANRTATAFKTRAFLDQLIHDLDPSRGPLYELLMKGFDETFDVFRRPGE